MTNSVEEMCSAVPPTRRSLPTAGGLNTRDLAQPAITAWRQIAERLEPVIGARGVDALFARALHLTSRRIPWLATNAALGNSAEALAQLAVRLESQEASIAAAAGDLLLLTFTGLLANMIGEPLTGRLLGALWKQDTPHSRMERQS